MRNHKFTAEICRNTGGVATSTSINLHLVSCLEVGNLFMLTFKNPSHIFIFSWVHFIANPHAQIGMSTCPHSHPIVCTVVLPIFTQCRC